MQFYSNFFEKIALNKPMNTIRLTLKKKRESQKNYKQKPKHKNPRNSIKLNTINVKKDQLLLIK